MNVIFKLYLFNEMFSFVKIVCHLNIIILNGSLQSLLYVSMTVGKTHNNVMLLHYISLLKSIRCH